MGHLRTDSLRLLVPDGLTPPEQREGAVAVCVPLARRVRRCWWQVLRFECGVAEDKLDAVLRPGSSAVVWLTAVPEYPVRPGSESVGAPRPVQLVRADGSDA